MAQHMLTTTDNPFDPREDFDAWNAWDVANGYKTLSLLARMVVTSDELSQADQSDAFEEAIDDVMTLHGFEMYKKLEIDTETTAEVEF